MRQWFIRGNVPSLKNSKIIAHGRLISPTVDKWRKASREDWLAGRVSFLEALTHLRRPYFVHLTFLRNRDNYWDITAPTETIADEMVRYGYINDDNIYEFIPVFGKPSIDRKKPGTIIKLLRQPPIYEFL